jgi:hypothetical protein
MLRIHLLGGLEVEAGVEGVEVPAGRPARLLLARLAAYPGGHARAEVAACFGPTFLTRAPARVSAPP